MIFSEKEKAIQAQIDELKSQLEQKAAAEEEAKYNGILTNFKKQITDHIGNNEQYELIRANDAQELVYDVIAAHHEETEEILDIARAADLVEEHLLAEAKRHLELNKIKGLLQPKEQPKSETTKKVESKTLSNAVSTKAPQPVTRKLSNEESMKEAAKLLKWE